MSRKLTQDEFVERSKLAHGDVYNYCESMYVSRMELVKITCPAHSTVFWQHAGNHMGGTTSCKMCFDIKKLQSRVLKRSETFEQGTRQCRTCSLALPFENFVVNKGGVSGYYSVCRKCCSIRNKQATMNPAGRAKRKADAAKYTRNNREAANIKSAARRANRLSRIPPWVEKEFESLFISEIYHLAKLREKSTGLKWHVDHMVPFISELVCGFHCYDNMQLIPALENLSKGNNYWPGMP